MTEVNIYIETNLSGIKQADGQVITILEFVASNSKKATKTLTCDVHEKTVRQAVLEAVNAALKQLNRSCEATIYLTDKYVYETIRNDRPQKWSKSHWQNAKGREVAYKELWQDYLSISTMHHIYVAENVEHEYRAWMRAQLL